MNARLAIAGLAAVALCAACSRPDRPREPRWEPQREAVQTATGDNGYIRAEPLAQGNGGDRHDVLISRIGPRGAVAWSKRFGGGDDDGVSSLQQTGDGGFILAGYTESFGAGSEDLWVIKLRGDGTVEWQKTFGGSDDDRARFVRQTRDLGYIVAGWSTSFVSGERDLWLLKLRPSGRVEWQTRFGRMGNACAAPFAETDDGGILYGDAVGDGPCDVWDLSRVAQERGTGPRLLAATGTPSLNPFQKIPFHKAALPASPTAPGDPDARPRARLFGRFTLLLACLGLLWLSLSLDLGPSRGQAVAAMFESFSPFIRWPAVASFAVFLASTAWRLVLWVAYRPAPALHAADPRLPEVTVVVPCYNEGAAVDDCIRSILESDYPAGKLRVIAVDDGSRDDSYSHMTAAAARAPHRVETIRFPNNRGKRHAMHAGLARTASPIAVTVDSDTVLPPGAIRALVTPLVLDNTIGAVAGRIEVLNRRENVITEMLGVRYRIGFDFQRAYQSILRSVFVCPGALTAYRMDAIRGGLAGWLGQAFLGRSCPTGDDHALTNVVLRGGWSTVYQSSAVALTKVPEGYRGLAKMYLRWARSNIRESVLYLGFAPRLAAARPARLPAVIDALASLAQYPLRLYLLVFGIAVMAAHPSLILKSLGVTLAFSLLHAVIYLRSERSLDVVYTLLYSIFSFLTLQWIYPWATVTVRQGRWMTR